MVKKKENIERKTIPANSSNVWDKCTHTPNHTRFVDDFIDNARYEICDECRISRRVK